MKEKSSVDVIAELLARLFEKKCFCDRTDLTLGLDKPSSQQLERLATYLEMLSEWSSRVDLVAPAEFEVLAEKHIIDSLAVHFLLEAALKPGLKGALLDIGSGAGLPGVVLAVMNENRRTVLCEPRGKRAVFLKEVRRELGLRNLEVAEQRVEDIRVEGGGEFALATTRALGQEREVQKEALRLLEPDGLLLSMLGPSWEEPVEESILSIKEHFSYKLPISDAKRKLVVWQIP